MSKVAIFGEVPAFRPLRRNVYEAVREAILLGDLAPGERVVEAELARQMRISRGPIREALRQLEQEGLVDYVPRRGVVVAALTRARVLDTYAVRAEMEGLAARCATERAGPTEIAALESLLDDMRTHAGKDNAAGLLQADVQFHELICTMADNPVLLKAWRGLGPLSWTLFSGAKQEGSYELTELAERHLPIVEAIKSGEPEVAAATARQHTLDIARIVADAVDARDDAASGADSLTA
jgi:DNA-binding GntR family transcriptional regulator